MKKTAGNKLKARVEKNSESCSLDALVVLGSRSPDANVEAVRAKLLTRSEVGLRKYGVTTERTDMEAVGWLRHAQEEAMDFCIYLEAEIQNRLREAVQKRNAKLSDRD